MDEENGKGTEREDMGERKKSGGEQRGGVQRPDNGDNALWHYRKAPWGAGR